MVEGFTGGSCKEILHQDDAACACSHVAKVARLNFAHLLETPCSRLPIRKPKL